jgi:hypothetical protein
MTFRGMMNDDAPQQHDDHIWLTVRGEAWAIQSKFESWIWLWRGYSPNIEVALIDVMGIDWVVYVNRALFMIYGDTDVYEKLRQL